MFFRFAFIFFRTVCVSPIRENQTSLSLKEHYTTYPESNIKPLECVLYLKTYKLQHNFEILGFLGFTLIFILEFLYTFPSVRIRLSCSSTKKY